LDSGIKGLQLIDPGGRSHLKEGGTWVKSLIKGSVSPCAYVGKALAYQRKRAAGKKGRLKMEKEGGLRNFLKQNLEVEVEGASQVKSVEGRGA